MKALQLCLRYDLFDVSLSDIGSSAHVIGHVPLSQGRTGKLEEGTEVCMLDSPRGLALTSAGVTAMPFALREMPVAVLDTKQGAEVMTFGPASTKCYEDWNVPFSSIIKFLGKCIVSLIEEG